MAANLGTLKAYLGLDISGFTNGLTQSKSALARASANMTAIGKNMTMKVTAPILATGVAFAKSAADVQTALRKSNTMAGLSVEGINASMSDLYRISNMTGVSMLDLSNALYTVASAGQRGKEAMEIVESSAKASAIGLGDVQMVAKSVTATLNAYGKENISAARATEILMGTVMQGNAEANELTPVIGRVVGMASMMGVSMEEVGGSIATFTRLGVDAAEAVTGIRGILNALMKPLESSNKAFLEAGYSMSELKMKIRDDGLAAAMIDLMKRFKGNDEAIADIIPNVRAMASMMGTAGVQAEEYSEIMDYLNSDLQKVDWGFQQLSQDSGFMFNKAMTQLKNTGITLGAKLLPVVNDILDAISNMVTWFNNLSDSTKSLTLLILGLVAGIGPAVALIGTLGTILAGMMTPVGLVVTALVALSVAIYYIYDNWEAVKERVRDWSWWSNMLVDMMQFLTKFNPFSLMIKGYNAMVLLFGGDPIPNPYEAMSEALEILKTETNEYHHEFKDFGETVSGVMKRIKGIMGFGGGLALADPGDEKKGGYKEDTWGKSYVFGGGMDSRQKLIEQTRAGMKALATDLLSMNSGLDQLTQKGLTVATVFSGVIKDSFSGLGNAMISGLESGKNAMESFKAFFVDWIKNMIAKMITLIVTSLILAAVLAMTGFGAAAGGGGIAKVAKGGMDFGKTLSTFLGAGLSGSGTGTQFKGLASGGFVTDGGIFKVHKQELITLPTGSAVTPANMARGGSPSGGGRLSVAVTGRELRFVLDEEDRRTKNTY